VATWVVGDVHGCWATLERLLEKIGPLGDNDRLWLIGDLVNRGPGSLAVLRWAAAHPRVDAVLGNHDLHLLARGAGVGRARRGDCLEEVLAASDRDRLLEWLRQRPLLAVAGRWLIVHAGLLPEWTAEQAAALADRTTAALSGPQGSGLLAALAGRRSRPPSWLLSMVEAASVMTRIRIVDAEGLPVAGFTDAPDAAPEGCRPWFEVSSVPTPERPVIFGHWAMLGDYRAPGVRCLDSACVHGGRLTAVRLDDELTITEPLADDDRLGIGELAT
jgi:bis(5'-nucleosyl)-tetraphosphatase (symmetrical)